MNNEKIQEIFEKRYAKILFSLFAYLLYVVFMMYNITNRSITGDEGIYFTHSNNLGENLFDFETKRGSSFTRFYPIRIIVSFLGFGRLSGRHPPIMHLIQGISIVISRKLGFSLEFAMRLPSVLFFGILILICFWFIKLNFGNIQALMVSGIFIFSPYFFYIARDSHSYALISPILFIGFFNLYQFSTKIIEMSKKELDELISSKVKIVKNKKLLIDALS